MSGFTSDNIVRYDTATGAFVDVFVAGGSGGLNGSVGLAWTPDGNLLVASYSTSEVLLYDGSTGAFIADFVLAGSGGLNGPIDLTWTPTGDLLVSGWLSGDVNRYDGSTGAHLETIASGMSQATGLSFGPAGDLYVGYHNGTSVERFDGTTWASLGSFVAIAAPFGVTWGPDGNLWVASETTDVINVYDAAGTLIRTHSDATDGVGGPWMIDFKPNHQVQVDSFVVNSTGDAGDSNTGDGVCHTGSTNSEGDPACSLRAAIEQANAAPGADTIEFAMPATEPGHSGGVWTISPTSELPQLTGALTLDATTQPGWTSTPVVEINGSGAGAGADGLRIFSPDVELRGFAVNRFLGDGIEVDTSSTGGVVIAGNHIGLDTSGLVDRGNSGRGIDLQTGSGPTTVGGTDIADRNVISGNGGDGIIVFDSDDNIIINNFIGTDATGNASGAGIGNGSDGIAMGSGSAGNTIGQPGNGNVLSGNGNDGFENDATGAGNTLHDNIIGLGDDGTTVVANGRYGVVLYNGANNTQIGGPGAAEGNVISGNTASGVIIDGNTNGATSANVIAGNFIGTSASGDLNRGNGGHGIYIFAGANATVVGGSTAPRGNVISGNGSGSHAGVRIQGATTANNVVQHNHIGINAAGNTAVPNDRNGVEISDAPTNDILDNVISANLDYGIDIEGAGADSNTVAGNSIGTNAAGTSDLGNATDGIAIRSGATNNTIGGLTTAERNIISGNNNDGIWITGSGTTDNTVHGNWIGYGSDSSPIGNSFHGIGVENGASNNLIGGDVAAAANRIGNSAWDGVAIAGGTGTGNAVIGNAIVDNVGLGIDISNDGVTANDAGDADTGPNDLLNFPVITSAIESGGIVTIAGNFDVPAGDYRFDIYKNASGGDPSGYGEGQTWVGTSTLSHSGSGDEPFGAAFPGAIGDIITATVTEQAAGPIYGSTSEFSAAATVLATNNDPTADAGGPYAIDEGESVTLDASGSSDPDTDPLTYSWDLDNDSTYGDAAGVAPTVSWATLVTFGIDDDGSYTVGLEVDDGRGGTSTATATIDVTNTAPTVIVTGPSTAAEGSLYTLNLSATDPGDDTITSWTVNWGDGTIETILGDPGTATHTLTQRGDTAEITASATDEDGTWWNAQLVVPGASLAEQLMRYDAVSGAFLDNLLSGAGTGVAGGTAWGPDGDLYVSVWQAPNRGVHHFDGTTFAHLGVFVADGSGGLGVPWGITFGPDGHLYVASNGPDGIYRYNGTTGAFIDAFATPTGNSLNSPGVITFGPDGELYVSSYGSKEVLRFDGATGAYIDDFVTAGSGGLDAPEGLAWPGDGRLYVGSDQDNSVKRYNATTGAYLDDFVPPGTGGLTNTSDIVFGPDGNLYVGSGGSNQVKRYANSTGTYLGNFVTAASGGLNYPYYMSFVPDLQVTITPPSTVIVVNSSGDNKDGVPGDDVCDTGATNADGRPECTLRAAIEEANASATIDTIEFAIPVTDSGFVSGPPTYWSIQPLLSLPAITEAVTIDATTQPFWSPTTAVFPAAIDASLAIEVEGSVVSGTGLEVQAGPTEIRGFAINRFATGISVSGGDTSTVAGNFIGTDIAGQVGAVGNTTQGILVDQSADNIIGGVLPADRNVISGNRLRGIAVDDWSDGVAVTSGGTQILGNYIGTTADGLAALPYDGGPTYQQIGIYLLNTSGATIGTATTGNVLSGNNWYGIYDWGPDGGGHTIQGNIVGLDAGASASVGNGANDPVTRSGIYLSNSPGNTIGGTAAGEGNTIAGNDGKGVIVQGPSALDNAILGNSLFDNAGIGIDLNLDEVSPNDAGDPDTGPNDLLNYPEIVNVQRVAGDLEIDVLLDVPAGDYRLEVFANTAADLSGHGEGETLLGAQTVTHTGSGTEPFALTVTSAAAILTLTATEDLGGGSYGATSEFSAAVPSPDLVVVNSGDDIADTTPGDGQCDTGGTNSEGAPECTLYAAIEEASNPATPVDTIWFAIPTTDPSHTAGVWTISGAALPSVTAETTIDATTQPGWLANTGAPLDALDGTMPIVLDGGAAGPADGLTLSGDDITVKGLVIGGFDGVGVLISGARAMLQGSYVGTNALGTSANPNTGNGISINGTDAVIGSPNPADRVLVAGNGSQGINVNAANAAILGSVIGLDATAATALPNGANGVRLSSITNATVGAPGAGNLISGNNLAPATADGIYVSGGESHTIQANLVGTNAAGDPLGNYNAGIAVSGGTDVLIGGTGAGEGNTVAHNGADAIQITGSSVDVSVVGNSLVDNTGLGIDIGNDNISPNDSGDGDTGPNGVLNTPVLDGAAAAGGSVTVDYTLDVPAGSYRIEFYVNPSGADPSGYGEGESFAAGTSIVHAGAGASSFSHTFAGGAGSIITATATETVLGNPRATSEFSNAITAVAAADTTMSDSSIRRSHLDARGTVDPSSPASGIAGDAVAFAGGTDRLVGPGLDITDGQLTLSTWVNLDVMGSLPRLISKRDGSGNVLYEVAVNDATGQAIARIRLDGSSVTVQGGAIAAGAWHQVTATWDGAELVLYVDGTEEDRVAAAGTLGTDVSTRVAVGSTAVGTQPVDGRLDHVTVAHSGTSAARVAAHHANLTDPAGFVTLGAEQTSTPGAWTVGGGQSRSGGFALTAPETSGADAAAWAVATGIDEPGTVFESWWWMSNDTGVDLSAGTRAGSAPTNQYESALTGSSGWELRHRNGATETVDAPAAGSPSTGAWVKVELWTDQLGDSRLFIDGTEVTGWTSQGSDLLSGSLGLRTGLLPTGETWYIDDARARKLITAEPTTTLGPLDRN